MSTRIDHIGIAVESLERRLPFWAEALGLHVSDMETVDEEKVRVAFIPVGESTIELLEASAEDSTIAGFIRKRGEGLHHLTLRVADLEASLEQVARHGVTVLGDGPRPGAGGSRVAFLHPKSTGGVLVELVERKAARPAVVPEIGPGSAVLLYLRDPQEKLWGVLHRMDGAGVVIEGIDLSSFDDWVAQIECGEENVVGPSVLFLPMGRVEKLLLDRASGHLPALADRFERRTGRSVQEVLRAAPSEDG